MFVFISISDICVTTKCHFDSSKGMYTYLACIGNYQLEQLRNNYVEVTENGKVDVNVRHYLDLDARKPVFGGLRTTQAQTSLRIRAD